MLNKHEEWRSDPQSPCKRGQAWRATSNSSIWKKEAGIPASSKLELWTSLSVMLWVHLRAPDSMNEGKSHGGKLLISALGLQRHMRRYTFTTAHTSTPTHENTCTHTTHTHTPAKRQNKTKIHRQHDVFVIGIILFSLSSSHPFISSPILSWLPRILRRQCMLGHGWGGVESGTRSFKSREKLSMKMLVLWGVLKMAPFTVSEQNLATSLQVYHVPPTCFPFFYC